MYFPLHDIPPEFHSWGETHYWTQVDSLPDAIAFTQGKTVLYTISWDETAGKSQWSLIYDKTGSIQAFTDGTAFAIVMDSGWSGTEVSGGDPARTEFYTLIPKPTLP